MVLFLPLFRIIWVFLDLVGNLEADQGEGPGGGGGLPVIFGPPPYLMVYMTAAPLPLI